MRLVGFAIYLGIGALFHAMFVGPQFDWTSAWTFGWLFGWPIMLFITFWVTIICLGIFVAAGWVVWSWLETIAHWREKRRKSKPRV